MVQVEGIWLKQNNFQNHKFLKVQEVQSASQKANTETNYQREETKRLRNNLGDLRNKLGDLEGKVRTWAS